MPISTASAERPGLNEVQCSYVNAFNGRSGLPGWLLHRMRMCIICEHPYAAYSPQGIVPQLLCILKLRGVDSDGSPSFPL